MREPEPTGLRTRQSIRIADLQLDIGQVRLTRDGREIAVPKLSFDLLVALAEAAPRLLTLGRPDAARMARCDREPETISQRVKLLRDALGDDAAHPRYVASVRGRGYRLIPNAEPVRATATPAHGSAGDRFDRAVPARARAQARLAFAFSLVGSRRVRGRRGVCGR
jgi:DNA-binding winged helix-turn-helix (wHTH) protein